MDVGGAVFTHWGQDTCDNQGALLKGIMASTDRIKGGSANIICLTSEIQEDEGMKDIKRHHR